MKRLQVEVNKAMRMVLGITLAERRPISELVEKLGVPTVNQLAAETTLMDTWRQLRYDLPGAKNFISLDEYVTGSQITRRTGRGLLAVPERDEHGAARFAQQGTRLWNFAPQAIRDEQLEKTAKHLIHDFSRTMPL